MSEGSVDCLAGRWVKLREPREEDLTTLYEYRGSPDLPLWSRRNGSISLVEFINEKKIDFESGDMMLVVEDKKSEVIGFVYAFDFCDRHVTIGTYIRSDRRGKLYGVEATALFLLFLAKNYEIVKFYFRVYEYNQVSLAVVRHAQFHLEGVFPRDRLWNGKLWAVYVYALYQEDLSRVEEFLSKLYRGKK